MGTTINLRDELEIESRGDAEKRHDEEMAHFASLRTVERRTILAALRRSPETADAMVRACWTLAKQPFIGG